MPFQAFKNSSPLFLVPIFSVQANLRGGGLFYLSGNLGSLSLALPVLWGVEPVEARGVALHLWRVGGGHPILLLILAEHVVYVPSIL